MESTSLENDQSAKFETKTITVFKRTVEIEGMEPKVESYEFDMRKNKTLRMLKRKAGLPSLIDYILMRDGSYEFKMGEQKKIKIELFEKVVPLDAKVLGFENKT